MYSAEIERLIEISEALLKKWNQLYFQEMSGDFRKQISVLDNIRNNILKFDDADKFSADMHPAELATAALKFHCSNLSQIQDLYSGLKTKTELREFNSSLKADILSDISDLTFSCKDEYRPDNVYMKSGIGSNRLLRKTGNFFYRLRILPRLTGNWFRRVFKKPEKTINPRFHTIYFQNLVKGFLLNEYISCLQKNTHEFQKSLVNYAHNLFELEAQLIGADYKFGSQLRVPDILLDFNEQFKEIEQFSSNNKDKFANLLQKSGTWEFPLFYMRFKLNRHLKHVFFTTDSTYRMWQSTFYAFYEDWRFREGLFSFLSDIKIQANHISMNYSAKLSKTLMPAIAEKRSYLVQLTERLPDPDNVELPELKHFFTSEIYKLNKETQNQDVVEDLTKVRSELDKLLQKIEVDINEAQSKLPSKSGVVRSPDYEKGIRKSDIYFFSPVEFIDFECIPPFLRELKIIKQSINNNFDEIVDQLSDFDQISDFTMDTAVSMTNEQNAPEQITVMFKEGMQRSLNILDRMTELGNGILDYKDNEITQIYRLFIENVKKLDDNDSILNIYSKLLKSKAIQETKNKRRKVVEFLTATFSSMLLFFKKHLNVVWDFYRDIRKRLKLDKAPVYVSSEISNYLSEINKRIYKLPVIYRYLFEDTPLSEDNLFLSRESEIVNLDTALKNWRLGNFAATLLIGENGVGKSSLIKHYIKTVKGGLLIKKFPVTRFYYSGGDFYELMQDIFENKELKTDQDIFKEIEKSSGNQIIILDGLERLFIRKPGGFECLNKFLSFLVSTNKDIFWICSVALHSCNYLHKTIALKENFDYLVDLNNLSSDQIKEIVLKRHKLSGYFIQYEDDLKPAEGVKKAEDRQGQLATEFFNELNKFSVSNISLSLYYWLEAISEFTDKEMFIKRFQPPDFSFLEMLSPDKIFTLLLIILHGKLNVNIHSEVCNLSEEKSRKILSILKEDSILILKDDYYKLNGILYRHVVQMLKNKNLIH